MLDQSLRSENETGHILQIKIFRFLMIINYSKWLKNFFLVFRLNNYFFSLIEKIVWDIIGLHRLQ